jgi:hypothetical protein
MPSVQQLAPQINHGILSMFQVSAEDTAELLSFTRQCSVTQKKKQDGHNQKLR